MKKENKTAPESLLKKENKTAPESLLKKENKTAPVEVVGEQEEEEDSVTEIVYEGKKYLKSIISGVVYDMDENEIGVWKNGKIELNDSSEEEEEEYD